MNTKVLVAYVPHANDNNVDMYIYQIIYNSYILHIDITFIIIYFLYI